MELIEGDLVSRLGAAARMILDMEVAEVTVEARTGAALADRGTTFEEAAVVLMEADVLARLEPGRWRWPVESGFGSLVDEVELLQREGP